MSKQRRVYELAQEVGLNKQEMVTRINGLGLGMQVNPMSWLSEADVVKIKRALSPGEAHAEEESGSSTKKKGTRKKIEEVAVKPVVAEPEVEIAEPVAVRRRKRVDEEEDYDPIPRPRIVVDETPAPIPAPAAVKVAVEEAPEPSPVDVAPPAPVEVKAVTAEPEKVEEAAVVAEAPVVVTETVAATPTVDAPEPVVPAEPAPVARTERPFVSSRQDRRGTGARNEEPFVPAKVIQKAPEKPRPAGGAQILGTISQTVLIERLAAEGKDFSPGPKRAAAKKPGEDPAAGRSKRIVEGRDLYDAKSRRTTKGRQKNGKDAKGGRGQIVQAPVAAPQAEHKKVIRIEDAITVGDLAHQMGVKAGQVAMKLLEGGMMANVNTVLDFDTASLMAEEFGYTVENVAFDITQFYDTSPDPEETRIPRPPVVAVMGHVDHGKTSLLDAIRSSSVATGEAGGITQHIGAYQVMTSQALMTFLDTPGHEAFTALRARGAHATDIVILVVAADDGVMPQTVEAINHAKAANVPVIVAINKIDKEGANPDRIRQALSDYGLLPEEWGGKTLYVEVSAKKMINIEGLLDAIMLQSEVEEFRANPERDAQGVVIEAQLDVGRGPVATLLVQRGTLKPGDIVVSGQYYGRVRTMNDERRKLQLKAFPSQPVEVTGLGGVPEAGEPFFVVPDEKDARRITQHVQERRRKEEMASRAKDSSTGTSLEDLSAMIREGELKELKVIIKGDVQGSVEALRESFGKVGNAEVAVKVIHSAVGGITESDVNLAASSENGVVIGFNVRPDPRANEMAEKYGVKILTFSIIYDAIDRIRLMLEGMLAPIIEESSLGRAEVRETYTSPKSGTIAGCYVTEGLLRRNARARLLRNNKIIVESNISSLRRFKDDVKEVRSGYECGLSLHNFNDIKIGDVVEVYELKEVAAKL